MSVAEAGNVKLRKEGRAEKASPAKESARERVSPHADEMAATTLARDALARERYEFLLKTIYALLGLLAVSLSGNIYFGLQETAYRYFAVDPQGGIREVEPLSRPIQSTTQVLNWSVDAIVRSLTIGFATYQQDMSNSKLFFTAAGWRGFEQALTQNGILDTIVAQKYVTHVVPTGAPVVIHSGNSADGFAWRIEMPIMVTFESASGRTNKSLTVEAVVVRRPETEHPSGLGISQIVAR
jgi:intracellular multiplication protein IcmL